MKNTIENCTAEDLYEKINSGELCQIIDVREEYEYDTVRIQNSILVPLSNFDANINKIDKERTAYMLCGIGKRATVAAEKLLQIGFDKLVVVDGGIKAWLESDYPVESCD